MVLLSSGLLFCSPTAIFPLAFLSPPPVLNHHGFSGTTHQIISLLFRLSPMLIGWFREQRSESFREDVDDG
ncbi:hypothetical protein F5879DRAFT_951589 [Lentinula edodes]|nr:hypothetical protein F5879DRAFT_951589 [Lentinula edodes]